MLIKLENLENIEEIFEEEKLLMSKLKKQQYSLRMEEFRSKRGHYINHMLGEIKAAEPHGQAEKEEVARKLADYFTERVFKAKSKASLFGGRKINSREQMELNLFMIYYVFPAILLTEDENAQLLCEAIKESWGDRFKNSRIEYTDYKTMYDNFNDKLLGAF